MKSIPKYWALLCVLVTALFTLNLEAAPWDHGPLQVSSTGRYLEHSDGTPFLWIGDTAWDLVQKLTASEVQTYFANRKAKGFTVIQITGLGQDSGLVEGINENGSVPFVGGNPYQRNATFWNYVDWIVDQAEANDLYLLFLPTWGYYGNVFDNASAYSYGAFLGARYGNRPNIIWSMGGDIAGSSYSSIWSNMANGILSQDSNHLITFHPSGNATSSTWFHNASWLDFNMYQSGHGTYDNPLAGNLAKGDWAKSPVKPTINGEPLYEHIPVQFWKFPNNPRFTAHDVRKDAYRSLFAGSFGHTYGHSSVWQMLKAGATPRAGADPNKLWSSAINDPGAGQMIHVGNLLVSRPVQRVPDESIISGGIGSGASEMRASRGTNYAFVYFPQSMTKTIVLGKISGSQVRLTWYNTSTGGSSVLGTYNNSGTVTVTPPSSSDWVLVIDNVSANFAAPGTVDLWYGSPSGTNDSLSFVSVPSSISPSGSFNVQVAYSCAGNRDIVVNVFDANGNYRGHGMISRSAGTSGTATVTVPIQSTITTSTATIKAEHRPAGGTYLDSLINVYETTNVSGGTVTDSLTWDSVPSSIPATGSFTVSVNYSCAAARDIVVNVFDANNVYRGEGKITRAAGSSGTATITVSIQGTISTSTANLKGEHRPAGGIWSDSLINIYNNGVTVGGSGGGSSNVYSGSWSARATVSGNAPWGNFYQTASGLTTNSNHVASFWMKGSGKVTLRVLTAGWGSQIAAQQFTATSTWTQYSLPTFSSGGNSSVVFSFSDSGNTAGTFYIDQCFLGTSGGTNRLANPGFESGNTSWTTGSWVSILQNP